MKTLDGKRVLITGAARGIGRALAERFARCGAHLVLTDLDEAPLSEARAAIASLGTAVSSFVLDVTDTGSIESARNRILDSGGPIDVLVNNAGFVAGGAFVQVPLARHEQTYRVNTLGVVATTHVFLPDLIRRPEAHIVNIASASGFIGLPFGSTYASSKWAVIGFSESLRLELMQTGNEHVRVTTVCPGYAATGMFSGVRTPWLTPMLSPPKIAERVVRAVSRDRIFVKIPWSVHLAPLLRAVLPTAAFDAVAGAFGITTSMRTWRGHEDKAPR